MKKRQPPQPLTEDRPPELSDVLNEHPAIQWTVDHRKELIFALIAFILLILFALRWTHGAGTQAELDYLKAQKEMTVFTEGAEKKFSSEQRLEALDRLDKVMESHPELHAQYDGAIAQTLINMQMPEKAAPYAERALKITTEEILPLYASFAENTLQTAEGHEEQALQAARQLDKELKNRKDTALYALNLLRIGMLHRALGNHEEELSTWESWKEEAGLNGSGKELNPGFDEVVEQFNRQQLALPDFIAFRKKELTDHLSSGK